MLMNADTIALVTLAKRATMVDLQKELTERPRHR